MIQAVTHNTHLFCHSAPISCPPPAELFFMSQPSMTLGRCVSVVALEDISTAAAGFLPPPPPKKLPNRLAPPAPAPPAPAVLYIVEWLVEYFN